MDNATTMYIVLGLLAIFFIVLVIFSAKTWRWLHLLSAVLVFIGAMFFVWITAATLQTHAAWRGAVNQLNIKIAQDQKKLDEMLFGELNKVKAAEDNIREVQAALERVLLDRPPVWRNCVPQVAGDSITLTIGATAEPPPAEPPPAEPPAGEAPPAAPAAKHTIEANNIVYGFLEGPSELSGKLQGFAVPKLYLGEFRVVSRTDTTVTIQPTMRLTPLQQASLEGGNWTLYDNIPIDAHYAFQGLSKEDLAVLFPKARMTITDAQYNARINQLAKYFAGMTPAQVAAALPKSSVLLDDDQYQKFLNQYIEDGAAANPETHPPERVWKKVTFLKPHSIVVDAGGGGEEAPLAAFDAKNFDATGLAVNQVLKQKGPTEFEPGDEATFDLSTADKLIASGVAKLKEQVYVRQLRDYKSFFDDSFRQEIKFEDAAAVILADTATLGEAQRQAGAQLTYRADELVKLKHDRDGFVAEVAAVTAVLERIDALRKLKLAKNSELYKGNLLLADQIRTEQLRQAADIYRRGGAPAEGESPPITPTPDPEASGAVSAP